MVCNVYSRLVTYADKHAESLAGVAITAANPPKPAAASGLLGSALRKQDEDGDDDDDSRDGTDLKYNTGIKNGKFVPYLRGNITNFARPNEEKEEEQEKEEEEVCCSADKPSSCCAYRYLQEPVISRRPDHRLH